MKKTQIEKAYAKINYYLYVGARRPDGFHDVETLMQTISLADDVEVSIKDGDGISLFVCGNEKVPCDRNNLVWRAAELFMKQAGLKYHIDICLAKHIPMAGGLAGGSADAAAVLRALNVLFDNRFGRDELRILAGTLGSDIPFCIDGGLALCKGRGEMITPIAKPEGQRHFLIVNRGESVSTADAYRLIDELPFAKSCEIDPNHFSRLLTENPCSVSDLLYNRFASAVLPLCPLAREAMNQLSKAGAYAVAMSGSGSTVFGMFDSREAAEKARKVLPFASVYAHDVF